MIPAGKNLCAQLTMKLHHFQSITHDYGNNDQLTQLEAISKILGCFSLINWGLSSHISGKNHLVVLNLQAMVSAWKQMYTEL